MKITGILLGMLLFSMGATAYAACEEAESSWHQRECVWREYKSADQELNRIYAQIMQSLDEDRRARLRQAERNWIRLKEQDCQAAEAELGGGSGGPTAYVDCLLSKTEDRIQELQDRYLP